VFTADTAMKMFVQHLQTPPVPPSERSELPIPPELDQLVLACLAKDPDSRPQTVNELLGLIDRVPLRSPWTNDSARQWWDTHLVELAASAPATRDGQQHTTLAVA